MLFEIKYQRKSDEYKRIFKASIEADGPQEARVKFSEQVGDASDYLIMGVRDISTESITLEVKDVSQKQIGKL